MHNTDLNPGLLEQVSNALAIGYKKDGRILLFNPDGSKLKLKHKPDEH
jgi:hypothetical protein